LGVSAAAPKAPARLWSRSAHPPVFGLQLAERAGLCARHEPVVLTAEAADSAWPARWHQNGPQPKPGKGAVRADGIWGRSRPEQWPLKKPCGASMGVITLDWRQVGERREISGL